MSKTRKAEKIVAKKKINKYTIEDCKNAIKVLTAKNQHLSLHGNNIEARYHELLSNAG